MKHDNSYYKSKIKLLGKLFYLTGTVRFFADGDAATPLWRKWHPLTWIMYIVYTPICGVIGEPITEVIPVKLNKYWEKRKTDIKWIKLF